MMKHDCDIVRDLMPMCMDGTASEKARQMVGEHVLECKKCMEMYQEMRTEVPAEIPVSKEPEPFGRTVRKLRKKRRSRRVITGIIGAVLGVMLVLVLGTAYMHLTTDYAVIAEDEDYGFNLKRRTNGQIVVTHYNYNGRKQDARWTYDEQTGILTFYAVSPTWALKSERESTPYLYNDIYWDNAQEQLMIKRRNASGIVCSYEVKEVRKGAKFKGNGYLYEILYVQGNDMAMVDASMDAEYVVPEAVQDGMIYYSVIGGEDKAYITVAPKRTLTPMPTTTPRVTAAPEDEAARMAEDAQREIEMIEAAATPMPTTSP